MNKRIKEVLEILEILVNDLQMLELDDARYAEAFKDAMALQAYIEAISTNRSGGNSGDSAEVVLQ